jgi:glyoxylase-like metal-dependent hydrolase (beta-lactamase superfamily II)
VIAPARNQPAPLAAARRRRSAAAALALGDDLRTEPTWTSELLKPLLARLVAIAVLLPVAGFALSRWWIGATTPPVVVGPGLVAEENAGVWLYAARLGGGMALVDAGRDPLGRPIDAALSALGARRAQVADVYLTHGHPAETSGLAAVPAARVHAGLGDLDLISGRERAGRGLDRMIGYALPRGHAQVSDPISGERTEGDGADRILALPVPGHSPGSTAYLLRGVLFAGDALSLRDGRLVPGPRFMSADPTRAARAVAALARRLADVPVSRICTAHAGCSPEGSGSALLAAAAR